MVSLFAYREKPLRYIDEVLQPGETIRGVTSVSWVGFLPGLALWLIAILLLLYIAPWSQGSPGWELLGWIAFARGTHSKCEIANSAWRMESSHSPFAHSPFAARSCRSLGKTIREHP